MEDLCCLAIVFGLECLKVLADEEVAMSQNSNVDVEFIAGFMRVILSAGERETSTKFDELARGVTAIVLVVSRGRSCLNNYASYYCRRGSRSRKWSGVATEV